MKLTKTANPHSGLTQYELEVKLARGGHYRIYERVPTLWLKDPARRRDFAHRLRWARKQARHIRKVLV